MRNVLAILTSALACLVATGNLSAGQQPAPAASGATPPLWAYPPNTPGGQPVPDDGTPKRVPGSTLVLTMSQINTFNAPDWYPDTHPPMPDVVARGRRPALLACGYCHYPNGQGRPQNANLAGLPAAYIVQQMADFKSGVRKGSDPKMGPPNAMIAVAKAADDSDVKVAADYFASLAPKPWVRIVESSTAPKTKISGQMHVPAGGGGTEPLGLRIVEMPEDYTRYEINDWASGFVAYVPVGAIEKGGALVTTGGARKTVQCGICHGPDLKGLGPVPGIAGRSPSQVFRQLWDMKSGARRGPWAALMRAVVVNLNEEDMISIAAYTASRTP